LFINGFGAFFLSIYYFAIRKNNGQ